MHPLKSSRGNHLFCYYLPGLLLLLLSYPIFPSGIISLLSEELPLASVNPLNFLSSKNVLTTPSSPEDALLGVGFWVDTSFLSDLEVSPTPSGPPGFWADAHGHVSGRLLGNEPVFSGSFPGIFPLSLVYSTLTIMCLDVDFFRFFLFGGH